MDYLNGYIENRRFLTECGMFNPIFVSIYLENSRKNKSLLKDIIKLNSFLVYNDSTLLYCRFLKIFKRIYLFFRIYIVLLWKSFKLFTKRFQYPFTKPTSFRERSITINIIFHFAKCPFKIILSLLVHQQSLSLLLL